MNFDRLYENWIKPTQASTLSDKLESKGWKYLGSGAFGTVFMHPKKNYVLKLYQDKGYRTFLNFLESEQGNPNVVMIKRNIFKDITDDVYSAHGELVALEKLKPLPYGSFWQEFIDTLWIYCPTIQDTDNSEIITKIRTKIQRNLDTYKSSTDYFAAAEVKKYEKILKALDVFMTRYKNLADTIFRLKKYVNENNLKVRFDLHGGNFMVRPSTGQIVITDPLAN